MGLRESDLIMIASIENVTPDYPPLPELGWSQDVEILSRALVVPAVTSAFQQPAGILKADGSYCGAGALWRNHRPLTIAPARPEGKPAQLAGRWVWGGVLWAHFGHFLVESTGRLWGLAAAADKVDGLIFISKRPGRLAEIQGFQQAFFDLCGIDVPVSFVDVPTEVETLIVAGQGFGLGQIIHGTPEFRTYIAEHFARDVAPEGRDKLYISRSLLGLNKGGLIGEDEVEMRLAAEGYEIFHPQKHDMRTQIARYKAATHIVAAEGSALHLLGMVGRPHQKVAMLMRRQSGASDQIIAHLQSFCGIEVAPIMHLRAIYKMKDGAKKRHDLGVLSLREVQQTLTALGFIADGRAPWGEKDWPFVKAIVKDKFKKRRQDVAEAAD